MDFNTITSNYYTSFNNLTEQISMLQQQEGDFIQEIEDLKARQTNLVLEYRNQIRIHDFTRRFLTTNDNTISSMNKYLNNNNIHGLLTASTQVGKTQATINFIEIALSQQSMVILTNDNHTDQQIQMMERIEKHFASTDIALLKITDVKFREQWKDCLVNNRRCIIFTLDNSSQINKLLDPFNRLVRYMNHIEKIVLIHDEADTITKDANTLNESPEQAESHKLWIEFTSTITTIGKYSFKRLFVTATPANCMALYNISMDDVINLECPETYSGYQDIQYFSLEDTLDIKRVLCEQVQRINDNILYNPIGEAIIISSDRLIANQAKLVESLSSEINGNGTIHTYNGADMIVYTSNNLLKEYLKNIKVDTVSKNKRGVIKTKTTIVKYNETLSTGIITLKKYNMAVADFYTICKQFGEQIVVTIGKDLITRAVSFVSRCKTDQLCATTMIYMPSKSMHAVGHMQTIGRITGCVRKDLIRRLFAPANVIKNYQNTNKNQEDFLLKLKQMPANTNTIQCWNTFIPEHHTNIQMDRPKLGLGKSFGKGVNIVNEDHTNIIPKITIVIRRWMANSNQTLSSKVFKLFIHNEMVHVNTIDQCLTENGGTNNYQFIAQLTTNDNKMYNHIFSKNGQNYSLTNDARNILINM